MDDIEVDPSLLDQIVEEVDDAELAAVVAQAEEREVAATTPPLARLGELLTDKIIETNDALKESSRKLTITLVEAGSFTVVREDGLYRHTNLIGGEEFELVAAFGGKDEKTLYWVMRPLFSCNFRVLHFSENDAKKFAGLNAWDGQLGELLKTRNELRQNAAAERERARIGSHEQYKEMGFGSW